MKSMGVSVLERKPMYTMQPQKTENIGPSKSTKPLFLHLKIVIVTLLASSGSVTDIASPTRERWSKSGQKRKCETCDDCSKQASHHRELLYYECMFWSWNSWETSMDGK